ncbi:uncharacterized protein LOC130630626 [Hydractinia symbiolongicarpus]|uniref:uncharacterized protein LOC130630626 n=1 Tax=Hydractinia symbiolongicarpus TaxID=13093 RepID=UPI00254FA1BC|nr:uncharacterized protein LOC130630626 [Hydractinia symbiolongicarpus]
MKTSVFKKQTNNLILYYSSVVFSACAAIFIMAALIEAYSNLAFIKIPSEVKLTSDDSKMNYQANIGYGYGITILILGLLILGIMLNILEYKITKRQQTMTKVKVIKTAPHSGNLAYQEAQLDWHDNLEEEQLDCDGEIETTVW